MKEQSLLNFYAFKIENNKIKAQIIIKMKVDEKHFICQVISPFDGCGNISILLTIEDLKDWIFIDNIILAKELLNDYYKTKIWRYNNPI